MAFTTQNALALYGPSLRDLMMTGFDAVHCWEEPYALSGVQVALWLPRNAQLTFTTFQNIKKTYPPPFGWLERFAMKRSDAWIAAATLVEQALEDRPGYRDRPHRIIGMGFDPANYRPDMAARNRIQSSFEWPNDDVPVIGFIGRLTEEKGVRLLLKTLDQLQGEWRALFVGSGPLEEEVQRFAARYGNRVRWLAAVAHDDVPEYLNAMDIMCAPSQTTKIWREQFGRVLIEAFACGVCVATSDSGEIPFVVADAAVVVHEDDQEGWRRALQSLISDTDRRRSFAARGLERAKANFTWSAIGEQYVALFDLLDKEKRVSAGRSA